jgi:hypothetical protein
MLLSAGGSLPHTAPLQAALPFGLRKQQRQHCSCYVCGMKGALLCQGSRKVQGGTRDGGIAGWAPRVWWPLQLLEHKNHVSVCFSVRAASNTPMLAARVMLQVSTHLLAFPSANATFNWYCRCYILHDSEERLQEPWWFCCRSPVRATFAGHGLGGCLFQTCLLDLSNHVSPACFVCIYRQKLHGPRSIKWHPGPPECLRTAP